MAEITTMLAFVAFMVLFTGPVVYFTWMSMQDDTHSPPSETAQ